MTTETIPQYNQSEIRKLFGFAVSKDAQDTFKTIRERAPRETITPELLGYMTLQIVQDAYEKQTQTQDLDLNVEATDTLTLLSAGVRDTYLILRGEFRQQHALTQEQAQAIAGDIIGYEGHVAIFLGTVDGVQGDQRPSGAALGGPALQC